MNAVLTIARLTWMEARRRRILLAALIGGLAFLGVFATAVYFINSIPEAGTVSELQRRTGAQFMLLAGLYVSNILAVALSILLPVDTLSGEIDSGVMQTLASKPIHRADILMGKWIGYWLLTGAYLLLMMAGIVLVIDLVTGVETENVVPAFALMLLGVSVTLTVSMAGGTRLKTVTNGIVAFAFYGIAFIGGWIEQIGAVAGSTAARRIGTAISLVSPPDAMWRRAAYELQPPTLGGLPFGSPFTAFSVPSTAMIVWTIGFVLAVLAIALYQFRRRAL